MKLKKIAKKDVPELLRRSAEDWQTFVPLKNEEGDTLFTLLPKDAQKLDRALERVNLKDDWVVISPKDIFFPQLENMLHFDSKKVRDEREASRKLIFGARPCDTKGMLFADEFFKRNFQDIYYLSRLKDRLIVTIGCLTPPRPEACFCSSLETGPFIKDGFDLQLVDVGDEYLIEIGTGKGEEFLDAYPGLFRGVKEGESDRIKNIKTKAIDVLSLKVDFDKALEIMKEDKDFQENYRRIGERCIYCGGCIYACPTCTCFNVFDDKREEEAVRRRNWDGCIFEGYTREASGHNPRNKKDSRTARRYEHKLKYDYSATGMSGCIGCGRCLASCPVEIGMSKFIQEITENTRNM